MLPRSPTKRRSGRAAASWAWRRSEPVATSARSGRSARVGADERVAGVAPLGHARDHQAGHGDRRQVLGRVDGEVGPAVEHGGLHLLGEDALAAELPDRDVEPAVALRVDDDELDLDVGVDGAQQRGDVLGLPPGERAAPGGGARSMRLLRGAGDGL